MKSACRISVCRFYNSILNEIPYVAAERCFTPWPDREKQLREGKIPLTSLEGQTPLANFDLSFFIAV